MSEPNVVEPTRLADACIIWLHGLGANRFDFIPVARALGRRFPTLRFIFPQAPTRALTVQSGMLMPSWYDIIAMGPTSRKIDQDQLEESAGHVLSLVHDQIEAGIACNRVFLAGFSQGGAVVLHAAFLRCEYQLGGVLALSTYAPTFDEATPLSEPATGTPVLHLHGTHDEVVPRVMGRAAHDFLIARNVPSEWRQYAMDHEVRPEEIRDIGNWLSAKL
jgi:phospholipase/carboxylesterase